MTVEIKNPHRLSRDFIQGLAAGAKDMLCDIYEVVERHKDNPNFGGTNPDFDSIEGIYRGVRCTQYYNVIKVKALKRFIANLDHIKELVDQRPEIKVVYYTLFDKNFSKETKHSYCSIKEYRTFRGYDEQEMNYLIGIFNRECSGRVIHEKNTTTPRKEKKIR